MRAGQGGPRGGRPAHSLRGALRQRGGPEPHRRRRQGHCGREAVRLQAPSRRRHLHGQAPQDSVREDRPSRAQGHVEGHGLKGATSTAAWNLH